MEILRETGPLLLGIVVIAPIVGSLRGRWSGNILGLVTFLQCLALGLIWSTFVGEQASPELVERLVALIVDTSLAYGGFSLVHWVVRLRTKEAT
jgi:hypothetical protein